jgi:hypothetical protein
VQLQLTERRKATYLVGPGEVIDGFLAGVTTTAELATDDAWRLGTLLRHRGAGAQRIGARR